LPPPTSDIRLTRTASSMAPLKLLGVCGALCVPLCRGAAADAAALLQTSAHVDAHSASLVDTVANMLTSNLARLGASANAEAASKPKVSKGVRFVRNITDVEEGSTLLMQMVPHQVTWADDEEPPPSSCLAHDSFGDNRCRFEYGTKLRLKVKAKIGKPIEEGSTITIDIPKPTAPKNSMAAMFLRNVEPIHVECPACSATACSVSYMGHDLHMKMPACPIPAGETTFVDKVFPIPSLPGLGSAEGTMLMKMGLKREDGSTLANVHMRMGMGSLEDPEGPDYEHMHPEEKGHKKQQKHHHH